MQKLVGLNENERCVALFTEGPATFTVPLSDKTVCEDNDVTFECEVSRADAEVKWYKNGKILKGTGKKLKIIKDGTKHKLVITGVTKAQAAEYTATVGKETTKGALTVEGMMHFGIHMHRHGAFQKQR